MATETMTSDSKNWPAVGNPPPAMNNSISPEDPNPEWEMIADNEENTPSNNTNVNSHVVILPGSTSTEAVRTNSGLIEGRRPRSATIGGSDAYDVVISPEGKSFGRSATTGGKEKFESSKVGLHKRGLRRCASTPDLMMSDNAHEVIVEDESDTEDSNDSSEDVELIEAEDEVLEESGDESFEVLSSRHQADDVPEEEDDASEPVMIDEEESATLVSTPSMGTSSWTMASSAVPSSAPTTSVWGMKKTLSFKDMLAKNIDSADPSTVGIFGKDKALTEAKLRDSHRRHHLRVRTKPKFVVSEDVAGSNSAAGNKMMKHANSTGDLSKMLHAVEEGHESGSFGQGGRNRRVKKQLSATMEEDEEGDFVIGMGSGGNSGSGGGGGGVDVLGDTDAMDYYHRKDHGSKSTSNKKKERPDEAKRREIIMYKKDMQRKKQQQGGASQTGGKNDATEAGGSGKKKKKNDKGFGGKKERRRL